MVLIKILSFLKIIKKDTFYKCNNFNILEILYYLGSLINIGDMINLNIYYKTQ